MISACLIVGGLYYSIKHDSNTAQNVVVTGGVSIIVTLVLLVVGIGVVDTERTEFKPTRINRRHGDIYVNFNFKGDEEDAMTSDPYIYDLDNDQICVNKLDITDAYGTRHRIRFRVVMCMEEN